MAAKPDVKFNVKWHPFIIDRKTDEEGEDMEAYCGRRWGSSAWTVSMRQQAKSDGANFDQWNYWPSTFHAHRLMLLADQRGLGHEASGKMFEMTYERGLNVSSLETLALAGEELGLGDVGAYLDSVEGSEEVNSRYRAAQKSNIGSVPLFLVNHKYKLKGAQKPETFESVFDRLLTGEQDATR